MGTHTLHLFEGVGIELEYMIVDARTLDVKPVADQFMIAACGAPESEVEREHGLSWSNELVNHVVEFKTTEPCTHLTDAARAFEMSLVDADALLRPLGARLLGSAMHPWMHPPSQARLWDHEYSEVYRHFDKLFDCRRHGWANLQSMHINLPFSGDDEFARLHAAVRLLLPLLPALAASSPIMDGRTTGLLDNRLSVYSTNQSHTPSLTGSVIPEAVFSEADYRSTILEPIARDVARLDPEGIMQPAWMNSRGAIARFDRGSIEIRVIDVQEHPSMDLAIAEGVVGVLKWLVQQGPSTLGAQQQLDVATLRSILDSCIAQGERAVVRDARFLAVMGFSGSYAPSACEVWKHLVNAACPSLLRGRLGWLLEHGPLARRMLQRLGPSSRHLDQVIPKPRLHALTQELADCLLTGPLEPVRSLA